MDCAPLNKAYQRLVQVIVRLILAIVSRFEVLGLENLPPSGPYIIVSNHLSKIDPPLVLTAFPQTEKRMRVFAADKWRRHPIFGPIVGLSGCIWVRRGEVDRQALREAIDCLHAGEVLGMAPEGTRSRTGVLQKARQGAAYIASRAQVPLVPVGIVNSDMFRRNLLRLRRTTLTVKIGQPFRLPELDRRAKSQALSAFTELIMAHIAIMLPERYHGYYAESPALSALQTGSDPWPAAQRAAEKS